MKPSMHAPRRRLLDALVGDDETEVLLGDDAQLAAMLAFERALAEAEADAGLIGNDSATAIASAIDRFTVDWDDLAAGLAQDGVVVPALVRQLRAAVGEPHGQFVHHGATSQDVIDTALVMQLTKIVALFLERIAVLEFGTRRAFGVLRQDAADGTHQDASGAAVYRRRQAQDLAGTSRPAPCVTVRHSAPVAGRSTRRTDRRPIEFQRERRSGCQRIGSAARPWHRGTVASDPGSDRGLRLAAFIDNGIPGQDRR